MASTPVRKTGVAKRSANGRVTTSPRKRNQSYDIDAEMAELFGTVDPDEIQVVEFGPLYGETWHLLKEVNMFVAAGLSDIEEDTAVLTRYMLSLVHPSERTRFGHMLARQIDLRADRLLHILKRMSEAVAEGNPTTMSSASSRSSKRTATKALSEAN